MPKNTEELPYQLLVNLKREYPYSNHSEEHLNVVHVVRYKYKIIDITSPSTYCI